MVEHSFYARYTWDELLAAIYGGLPPKDHVGPYGGDYSQSYPGGMFDISEKIQDVHNVLLNGSSALGMQLVYLKKHWQGPGSNAFQKVSDIYIEHIRATFHKMNWPNWRLSLRAASGYLNWAQQQMFTAYDQGYVKVTRPPMLSAGESGPQTKTIWSAEAAAQAGRQVLIAVVNKYFELETQFNDLPVPPELGEPPSAAADKAEAKKEADDAKKDAEEKEKQAEEDKKKLDEDIAKEKAEAKETADKAAEDNKAALDKFNQPPPPPPGGGAGGDLPGDAGEIPEPPGGLGEPPELPKGLAFPGEAGGLVPPPGLGGVPVPGGTDLTGDGIADLDEDGKPVPGFGDPVPGGIDISGDGKPDFDEDGNPLPGGDFSTAPPGGSPVAPFVPEVILGRGSPPPPLGPPPGLGRGSVPIPTDEPIGDKRPGGKPFVRPPKLDLDDPVRLPPPKLSKLTLGDDGPPKLGSSVPFVRSPGGGGAGADEFGGAKLPKSGGGLGVPVNGPAGGIGTPLRSGIPGFPGAPGTGTGGYPPPMGGMGGGAPGMGGQQNGERERQTWLLEDDEIWADDDEVTSVLGRPAEDDDDEEYEPQI